MTIDQHKNAEISPWWKSARVLVPAAVGAGLLLFVGGWALARATADSDAPAAVTSATAVPSPSPTPSGTQVAEPPAVAPTCAAEVDVTSEWSGGFQANVIVSAFGDVEGWTVTMSVGDAVIDGAWNTTLKSGASGNVTASNVDYNGTIPDGGTATLGFTASGEPDFQDVACTAMAPEAD